MRPNNQTLEALFYHLFSMSQIPDAQGLSDRAWREKTARDFALDFARADSFEEEEAVLERFKQAALNRIGAAGRAVAEMGRSAFPLQDPARPDVLVVRECVALSPSTRLVNYPPMFGDTVFVAGNTRELLMLVLAELLKISRPLKDLR
jgi:hypothetical protein